MLLIPLLRKEFHWSKRNVLILVFLLLMVPIAFGGATLALQDTVPENVPVATYAQSNDTTDEDITAIEAVLNQYTDPQRVDKYENPERNFEKAVKMLEREEVYVIIEVPPNIRSNQGIPPSQINETFRFYIDGNIAPLGEVAPFLTDFLGPAAEESDTLEGNFTIEQEILGTDHLEFEQAAFADENEQFSRGLGAYLFPTFLMALMIFFAFTYVPYNLSRDADVLDRLRVETSIESLIGSKLLFLTGLMVFPLLTFGGISWWFEYQTDLLSPVPFGIMLLSFSLMATISMTVMVLTRFSGDGQFINLLLMLGVLVASGIDLPLGVISDFRPTIAQLSPIHYATVAARSLMLKDVSVGMYSDMILYLAGSQVIALVVLKGAIVYYRRTR